MTELKPHRKPRTGTAPKTYPRGGVIRKEFLIKANGWYREKGRATIGLEVNYDYMNISVQLLLGQCPDVKDLFSALLADRDVRRLIKKYQEKGRVKPYKIWMHEGYSGCKDFFITIATKKGSFITTETKKLMHISMYDKMNEGFGDENHCMYIGDFAELYSRLGYATGKSPKELRKSAKVKYIKPRLTSELETYEDSVIKLI